MTEIICTFVSVSCTLLVPLAICLPEAIPWGARGRAARQLRALWTWHLRSYGGKLTKLHAKADGYFAVRDYLGVESAYIEARRIIDEEPEP